MIPIQIFYDKIKCFYRKKNIFNPRETITQYYFFSVLRVLLALLPQTGYIHPDEFFQSMEVALGESFDIDVYKPWEYNILSPIRSYFFPYVTVTCPYYLLKMLNYILMNNFGISLRSPYYLIVFPRVFMSFVSFICDYCLYKICIISRKSYAESLLILASSYVMLTYGSRTFSNTIEMILVSLLLYRVSRCMEFSKNIILQNEYLSERYHRSEPGAERAKYYKLLMSLPGYSLNDCFLLSTITVLGLFNRPTFFTFALIPIFFWLHRGLGSRCIGFLDFHIRIFIFIICGIPVFVGLVVYDSLYFGYLTLGEIENYKISLDNFIVTPFNFLKYNFKQENLEKHGLHPHFLHFLVNIPLLFNILGIFGLILSAKMIYRGLNNKWLQLPRLKDVDSLMAASFMVPIILLSIFPHQEPRFIIPVILPLVFLQGCKIKPYKTFQVSVQNKKPPKISKNKRTDLMKIWILINFFFTVFYGFIHQGGVFPLTRELFHELQVKPYNTEIHIVTSHSYPIPTGLLLLRNTQRSYVNRERQKYRLIKDYYFNELGSKNVSYIHEQIISMVQNCDIKFKTKNINCRMYYALPASFLPEFMGYVSNFSNNSYTIQFKEYFFPHLSTEKLPENIIGRLINFDNSTSLSENFMKQLNQIVFGLSLVLIQIESFTS